jgi:hypothetical protein
MGGDGAGTHEAASAGVAKDPIQAPFAQRPKVKDPGPAQGRGEEREGGYMSPRSSVLKHTTRLHCVWRNGRGVRSCGH